VIGFLNSRAPGENPAILAAFRRGFEEAGYGEGQNVMVEYRWADGQYDRLPALAADLVDRRVAAIVANGPAVQTAKSATSTLPIIFVVGFDPLAFGLVGSLSRPGGNLTGVTVLDVEIGAKRLPDRGRGDNLVAKGDAADGGTSASLVDDMRAQHADAGNLDFERVAGLHP